MKVSPYAGNISRNQYEDKPRATTERVRNTDRGSEMIEAAEPPSKNCLNKKWILILIISILILIIPIFFPLKKNMKKQKWFFLLLLKLNLMKKL